MISTPEGEWYIPCVNISAEPEAYFRIAPEDWLRAEMQGGELWHWSTVIPVGCPG
ncbi:tail assembly domain protein [Escherichia coli 2534-86]|nr:tail assembly domain protein [Escherichia coli 2534-86]